MDNYVRARVRGLCTPAVKFPEELQAARQKETSGIKILLFGECKKSKIILQGFQ